jgi:hypothetical protein
MQCHYFQWPQLLVTCQWVTYDIQYVHVLAHSHTASWTDRPLWPLAVTTLHILNTVVVQSVIIQMKIYGCTSFIVENISKKFPSNKSIFRQQVSRRNLRQLALAWRPSVDHLTWIAQQRGIFVSSAQNATWLHLQPHNAPGSPTPWCRVQNKKGLYVGECGHLLCMVMKPGFSSDFLTLSVTGTCLRKTTLQSLPNTLKL